MGVETASISCVLVPPVKLKLANSSPECHHCRNRRWSKVVLPFFPSGSLERIEKEGDVATDDALYGTFDIYLKAHPGLSKQERERLFLVIESRKLLAEASIREAQKKWVEAC